MDSKTLCLAVLLNGEASGYEIKKTLESAPFSHFQETSFGSIYPALTRLTDDGLVSFHEMAQDKRPDKKVYSITEKGRQALVDTLLIEPAPDRYRSDFLFVLFMGQLLPAVHLARVVDRRIAYYEEQIAQMESCGEACMPASPSFVHGFGLAVYRAALDYLKRHRDGIVASGDHPAPAAPSLPDRMVAE